MLAVFGASGLDSKRRAYGLWLYSLELHSPWLWRHLLWLYSLWPYLEYYGDIHHGYTYRCPHDQPQSAQDAIEYTFLIGVPIVCVSIASLCLAYPIKGERLRLLKEALATAKAKDAPATDDGKDIQLDIARSTGLTPCPAVHDMDE